MITDPFYVSSYTFHCNL